jgi:outer membrane murein-binding lipoprotein Lpp
MIAGCQAYDGKLAAMATAFQREDAKVIALYGAVDVETADLEAAKRNSAAA